MRALTVSQPFASMIADGEKWVENRKWCSFLRGPLAIHAGKGTQYLSKKELLEYPSGILAVVNLVECVFLNSIRDLNHTYDLNNTGLTIGEILKHKHTEGPWCWILNEVFKLDEPIKCSGALGLWDWEIPENLRKGLEVSYDRRKL